MAISCPRLTVLLAGALMCSGCAVNNTDMLHFLREQEHDVSAIEYRVGIPDAIAISAPRILELDGEMQRIQPDGKINLRLLGEVKVVGMTAKEIAAKLEVLLSPYYRDPGVSVRVLGHSSKKYYVQGQVGAPGPRIYTGRDTLIDAVLTSGADFRSWTARTTVIRPAYGDMPVRKLQIDVDRMVRTGDWSQNILLEPDDIVHIPPTPLAWVGLRVQELLFPVAPVLQAYVTPAEAILANDYYDDLDNGSAGRRPTFRR